MSILDLSLAIPHISAVPIALALILINVPLGRLEIQTAKTNYDAARFENVVKQLREADFSALERNDASQGMFMLGVSELALGNDALSQKAFARLFNDDPDFEPPQSSKKVTSAIERARKQVVMSIRTDMQGEAVRVCGTALPRRSQIKVIFTTPTGEEAGFAAPDGKCFSLTPQRPTAVNGYYVSVSVDGDVRATAGSRAWPLAYERNRTPVAGGGKNDPPPLKTKTTAEEGTPWYKHWATWTVVGVVVVGAVTAAVVVTTLNNQKNALGKIEVQVLTPPGNVQ